MSKKYFLWLFLFLSNTVFSSQLGLLPPDQLNAKSEFIIFGQVLEVKSDSALDHVTVKIFDCLKGKIESETIMVILQVRGGLKEWSPQLKKENFGVFYLRRHGSNFASAYGGSIAVFPKHQFVKHPSNNVNSLGQPKAAPLVPRYTASGCR